MKKKFGFVSRIDKFLLELRRQKEKKQRLKDAVQRGAQQRLQQEAKLPSNVILFPKRG